MLQGWVLLLGRPLPWGGWDKMSDSETLFCGCGLVCQAVFPGPEQNEKKQNGRRRKSREKGGHSNVVNFSLILRLSGVSGWLGR